MPKKHHRPDAEVEQFAAELAGRWHRSDGIEPWLRSMWDELFAKHRQRWTWESIARALNCAGIQYETGRPWNGNSLRKKLDDVARSNPPPARAPLPMPAVPALTKAAAEPDALMFKPATLLNWSGTMVAPEARETPAKSPAPALARPDPTSKVEAVLARLMGQQQQPTGEDG